MCFIIDIQAIRIGDAYALLVEYHFKKGNAHDAFDLLQQMRQGNIALHPYLESNLLEQIHKTVGVVLLPDEKGYMPPADEGLVKEEVGQRGGGGRVRPQAQTASGGSYGK